VIFFSLPFHTISGDNDHRGWRKKYEERIKPQRGGARSSLQAILSRESPAFIKRHKIAPIALTKKGTPRKKQTYSVHELVSPILVKVTRVAPAMLDRHDGLQSSLKPVIDGLADALGLATDEHPLVKWEHYQRKGDESCVEVQIWEREERDVSMLGVEDDVFGILAADWANNKFLGGRLRILQGTKIVDLKVG
jgi:hypothetical protein